MADNLETFRPFVPVEMLAGQPVARRPETRKQEAGARWGGQSAFTYSAQGRYSGGAGEGGDRPSLRVILPSDAPKIYKRVINANLQVNRTQVRVRHPDDPERFLEVLRTALMSFAYTELREKKRPGMQPRRHSSWHLALDLHPPNEAS